MLSAAAMTSASEYFSQCLAQNRWAEDVPGNGICSSPKLRKATGPKERQDTGEGKNKQILKKKKFKNPLSNKSPLLWDASQAQKLGWQVE